MHGSKTLQSIRFELNNTMDFINHELLLCHRVQRKADKVRDTKNALHLIDRHMVVWLLVHALIQPGSKLMHSLVFWYVCVLNI